MTAKHTPGPWYKIGTGIYIGSPETDDIAHIATAHCYGVPGDPVANIALIAAAPDLLAALREAVDSYKPMYMSGTEWVYPEWHEQARAAIAKAEGQT